MPARTWPSRWRWGTWAGRRRGSGRARSARCRWRRNPARARRRRGLTRSGRRRWGRSAGTLSTGVWRQQIAQGHPIPALRRDNGSRQRNHAVREQAAQSWKRKRPNLLGIDADAVKRFVGLTAVLRDGRERHPLTAMRARNRLTGHFRWKGYVPLAIGALHFGFNGTHGSLSNLGPDGSTPILKSREHYRCRGVSVNGGKPSCKGASPNSPAID